MPATYFQPGINDHHQPCVECEFPRRRARYAWRFQWNSEGTWVLTTIEPTHCRTCMRAEQDSHTPSAKLNRALALLEQGHKS